ncbi:unnamed protein product [Ilex paraguariensis]|uniref:Protein FLX-like 4 n=1 Tax=Ilex paraguariensis TaxID=185542 RepID=A0ABC8R7F1_9AQUA
MDARGRIPPAYEGRSVQAPGMMRHGTIPAGRRTMEPLHPEILENKLAVQTAEIERLAGDNHKLAATHVALRQDLVAAQQEIQRLRAHMRSIETESDIQIRVLLDKTAKMEVDIRAAESVKKELQQANIEAKSLVKARQELTAQIQLATQDLDHVCTDIKNLPEMHAELDSLRQEHQRLRTTFEYEKGFNIEKVQQMQVMEKDLVAMAREVEKLRAEVFNAEKRAHAPNFYGGPYMNPNPLYAHPMHGSGAYVDSYGRPHTVGEGMIPYASGNVVAASSGVASAAVSNAGGSSAG